MATGRRGTPYASPTGAWSTTTCTARVSPPLSPRRRSPGGGPPAWRCASTRDDGGTVTLLVDGAEVGSGALPALARARTGYTGVDVGCDRGLTVGGYDGPARFTGRLARVEIEAADDQVLDEAAIWAIAGTAG